MIVFIVCILFVYLGFESRVGVRLVDKYKGRRFRRVLGRVWVFVVGVLEGCSGY